ncbi:MAG: adenylate/guanylate cyclase domain-containing protein [Polyangiaceae bacterium]
MSTETDQARLEAQLSDEVNRALARGSLYALALACLACLLLLLSYLHERDVFFLVPLLFTVLCAVASGAIHVVAKQRRMRGNLSYAVMLPFASLPTTFFLAAELLLPSGAATYVFGPMAHLYAFCVAVTGFLFNPRLTLLAGVLCGVQYELVFLGSVERLSTLSAPDPMLLRDLVGGFSAANRVVMLLFTAAVVAGIATIARRLVLRVLQEERDRARVTRLFGQYVSDEVRERILQSTAELRGEQKRVAVLFSDIRGFSSFSEHQPPAVVVERLNEYFDAMLVPIREHGGVVDKFIGDAIMAVFGGLLPTDNPAAAALAAARGMRESLAALNRRWAARDIAPFESGIGIHVGEVVQGPIGSAERKEFTVIGDTVNTASRVEGLTKELGCPILLSEAAVLELPEPQRAELTPRGDSAVKGKQERVTLYGLVDASRA